ncbi:hypothetical protein PCASD_00417 [Puccinia coronata f. sp. avenae]|uniref:Uncharacterized protein n=1 Tax=Puccinia coronata f. sp. avenae TaxID=200324 RepID=A0A2N5VN24_9BASI|nr:hypothetical protein PCASD_00417 [Puccinia coronata f. sp. avenae]
MADSQVLNMPTKWVCFIDEGADDDFDGFFSLIELFTARRIVPIPAHMLQLIGLVVNPMQFLRSQVPASCNDPVVLSGKNVAWRAWSFLDSFFKTSGTSSFLKCLPGHNHTSLANLDVILKESFRNTECSPTIRRLIDPTTVWDILLAADDSAADQTIGPGAWDFLALLISAWEIDFKNQGVPDIHTENQSPLNQTSPPDPKTYSPHFLRQLSEAPAGGFRIDSRVYDIIFEPFGRTSDSPSYSWGCATNTLARAQELSIRLLHLLVRLDAINLLETGRLREDIVIRMRGLKTPDFHVFVNLLPPDHLLRTRLLSRFLESVTRSQTATHAGLVLSESQGSASNLSPSRSGLNGTTGLRRVPSRTALKLDDRPTDSTISSSKSHLLSMTALITQLLPRPLLDIPTAARRRSGSDKIDVQVILEAELRYLSVLSVILGSLLAVYRACPSLVDQEGLNLVTKGKLTSAVQNHFNTVNDALGFKLDSRPDDQTRRNLLHRQLNRTVKAFQNLALKPPFFVRRRGLLDSFARIEIV